MPNALTSTGLQTKTRAELLAEYTAALQGVYGIGINLDPDSPDGQELNIRIQAVLDILDLITQVYNSFDPDSAIGATLDMRVAINGIERKAGTYTITYITITTSKALTLYGLDQDIEPVYTVSDNAGNKWFLITSTPIAVAGDSVLSFRAEKPGKVYTTPNTITVPVTIVLGVTAINNPSSYSSLGIDEESDVELKIRRRKSVSLASQGYLASLEAALNDINGLSTAIIYENDTASTDSDGIPSHSIWVIVGGVANNSDIASAIYKKRNSGCGMKGSVTYVIIQVDGSEFVVRWDVVASETLYTKFSVSSLDGVSVPDIEAIRSGLVTSLVPDVYEQVNVNDLSTKVQEIDSNTLVTNAGFGLTSGGSYYNSLRPSAKNKQFSVIADNIIILPILISSTNSVVAVVAGVVTTTLSIAASSTAEQFTTLGGFGSITYSKTSGTGSITSGGLYTPPGAPGSAVVRATDALGNYIQCAITIT